MQRFPGRGAAHPNRILASLLLLTLAGCEPFFTKEFARKPNEVAALGPAAGDSAVFRVTESLWKAGAKEATRVLARKRVAFKWAGDSAAGAGDTVRLYSMRVTDEATGEVLETGLRALRLGAGVELRLAGAGGGARFFPMKAAAGVDSAAFRALPALFSDGLEWSARLGILEVTREVAGADTLDYRGRLEESWRVAEKVWDAGRLVAGGDFWYGASGLLRASQAWDDFDWRDADGAAIARATLRRELVRL